MQITQIGSYKQTIIKSKLGLGFAEKAKVTQKYIKLNNVLRYFVEICECKISKYHIQ